MNELTTQPAGRLSYAKRFGQVLACPECRTQGYLHQSNPSELITCTGCWRSDYTLADLVWISARESKERDHSPAVTGCSGGAAGGATASERDLEMALAA